MPDKEPLLSDSPLALPTAPDLPVPPIQEFWPVKPEPPKPTPSTKPVAASPRTDPGSWVSSNDYPTRELRQGNEGAVRFLLSIDAAGKVQDCTITRSSGHPGLDAATCKYVTRRAKFEPARDSRGIRVIGSYANTIRWVIPQ